MLFSKKNSLTDQFHSHGVLTVNGKGYHVRKDGANSISWRISAGNSLRFTPADFEQHVTHLSKLINLTRENTQFEFLYDKYELTWENQLKTDSQTRRPEIAKLMQIRQREIGATSYYALDIYLTITFNHLIDYKPPVRQDFFNFGSKHGGRLARSKFEQDVRQIENTAALVEHELSGFSFKRLNGDEITNLLKAYYNLSHEPAERDVNSETLNSDLVYKSYAPRYDDFVIGMDHVLVASMIELPDKVVNPVEADRRFLRSPLDYFLNLPFPLRLAVRMQKLPSDQAKRYVNLNKMVNKPRFNNVAEMKMVEIDGDENGEQFEGIANLLEFDKDYLADLSLTLWTWHPERAVVAERQDRIISTFTRFFNSKGLIEVGQDALNVFLSNAPGNYPYRKVTVRGAHLGHFICFSDHYKGMNSGVPIINVNGELVRYDLFSSDNDNYNTLIVGPSGKGKSFFCNALIFNYIAQNVPVIVLDLSGSYKPLADVLSADYVQIDKRRPSLLDPFYYFNPSQHPFDSPDFLETLTYLQSFINLMLKDEGGGSGLSKDKKAMLYAALEKFFQTPRPDGTHIHAFLDFLKSKGRAIFDDESFYLYVIKTLGYYLEKSALKVYFDPKNPNPLRLNTKERFELIVFDLKGIEREIDLMPLYANLLSMLVMNALHHDLSRFFFILDEAWKALDNSEIVYGLVKETGRTSRKHFGSVAALSQNIEDLKRGDLAASVLTNSFSKFLLPHVGEDQENAVRILDMTKAEQRAFRNLKKHEICLCREGEPVVFKLPFSQADYWTWTTKPDEVRQRNGQMERESNVIGAISALVENNVTRG